MKEQKSREIPGNEIFLPPNVALMILFVAHNKRENLGDFRAFQRRLWSSDIFIPESPNMPEEDKDIFKKIARGDKRIFTRMKNYLQWDDPSSFTLAEMEALYGSRATVCFADIDRNSDINDNLRRLNGLGAANLVRSSLSETIQACDSLFTDLGRFQRMREEVILRKLGPILRDAISSSRKLSTKDRINVLMLIGASHDYLYEVLQEVIGVGNGLPSVDAETIRTPNSDFTEIYLHDAYRPEKNTPWEEKRRLILENLARAIIETGIEQGRIATRERVFEIVKGLSEEDISALFESIKFITRDGFELKMSPICQKIQRELADS